MSRYYDIERALVNHYLSVDAVTPTGYPGYSLGEENKPDDLWVQLHNLRVETEPVTMGINGEDNLPGLFQIDINYPAGQGTKELLEKADELYSSFNAGNSVIYNGQTVVFTACSLGPLLFIGGYARVPLTASYYSRVQRNI